MTTYKHTHKPKPLTPTQLLARQPQLVIIDVRSWLEYVTGHIPHARKLDRTQVLREIPKDQAIAVVCLSGHRSLPFAHWLLEQGYETVYNLQGGGLAWQKAGYPLKTGIQP